MATFLNGPMRCAAVQRTTRARIFGATAAAAGVPFLVMGQWAPAIGLFSIAAAAAVLITRDAPQQTRMAVGPIEALGTLVNELRVAGHGIIIPHATHTRIFIPAATDAVKAAQLPTTNEGQTFHREGPAAIGIEIASPGQGLEHAWRDAQSLPQGAGLAEAADHIRRALDTLELGTDVRVARAGDVVRISYTPHAREACDKAAESGLHDRAGCPTCTFFGALLAHGERAPVRLRARQADERTIHLDLEVVT